MMAGGGLYNMALSGTGWVAVLSDGRLVLMNEDAGRPRVGRDDPARVRGPGLGSRAALGGPGRGGARGGRRGRWDLEDAGRLETSLYFVKL